MRSEFPWPLALLAAMLATAAVIEVAISGRVLWVAKLPLATLLAIALARSRGGGAPR